MSGIRNFGNGIFRLDASGQTRPFPRYVYLVTSGEHGTLIDPGPREDFAAICDLLKSMLPIERISSIILTGETPDSCSSLPLWKRSGFTGKILTHWKAELLARFYGGGISIRAIMAAEASVDIGGGRILRLINVPGIPTAGSLFCFDPQSGSLFTGMLFGSSGADGTADDEETPGQLEYFHDLMFPRLGERTDISGLLRSLKPLRAFPRNGPPVESRLPLSASLFMKSDSGKRDLLGEIARLRTENLELKKSII